MAIVSNNRFPKIILEEQASAPTPAPALSDGEWMLIMKSDNKLYKVDHNGTETEVGAASASGIPTDGWIDQTGVTWTRTGNHVFTISGDVTATYRKGTMVRYKDGGSFEYGVVINAAHAGGTTTVTLATNTDYTMAATTITDNYISHIETPEGWPGWFSYTPTYSASGSMTYGTITTAFAKRRIQGRTVQVQLRATGTTGGSASTAINATLPVEALQSASSIAGYGLVTDGGGQITARVFISAGTPDVMGFGRYDASNWGTGSGRVINGSVIYEME